MCEHHALASNRASNWALASNKGRCVGVNAKGDKMKKCDVCGKFQFIVCKAKKCVQVRLDRAQASVIAGKVAAMLVVDTMVVASVTTTTPRIVTRMCVIESDLATIVNPVTVLDSTTSVCSTI